MFENGLNLTICFTGSNKHNERLHISRRAGQGIDGISEHFQHFIALQVQRGRQTPIHRDLNALIPHPALGMQIRVHPFLLKPESLSLWNPCLDEQLRACESTGVTVH